MGGAKSWRRGGAGAGPEDPSQREAPSRGAAGAHLGHNKGRTHLPRRRTRTWVSAASSAAPGAPPAAAKMARSGDAGRRMSQGGRPPELLPGQVRPGRSRRWEEGGLRGERERDRGRSGGRVAA